MKESFPFIDPLTAGHKAADKILEAKLEKDLHKRADEVAFEEARAKKEREEDLNEIYQKDEDEEWFKK